MKHLFLSLRLFGLFALTCHAQQQIALPEVIAKGFVVYQKSGSEAAWNTWNPDYGDRSEEYKARFLDNLGKAEKLYGAYLGADVIKIMEASAYYQVVHVIARYEKSPLFFTFTCYKAKDTWAIKSFTFSTTPEKLPEFMNPNKDANQAVQSTR